MSGNIKTIKFTAKLSVLFALFTYIISLNMEFAFFTPNWVWMSNNLALTICSGIFVSVFVIMLDEIRKYWRNKMDCECYLFYQTMYLYISLFQMQKNVEEYIGKKSEPVVKNLLELPLQKIQCQVNAIQGVDYATFCSKSELMIAQQNFCAVKLNKYNAIWLYDNYFKRAILMTKTNNLKQFGQDRPVTSSDELVCKVLTIIDKQCQPLLHELSNYLMEIDCACNKRFGWDNRQKGIHESYRSIFKADGFEDFLKQGE